MKHKYDIEPEFVQLIEDHFKSSWEDINERESSLVGIDYDKPIFKQYTDHWTFQFEEVIGCNLKYLQTFSDNIINSHISSSHSDYATVKDSIVSEIKGNYCLIQNTEYSRSTCTCSQIYFSALHKTYERFREVRMIENLFKNSQTTYHINMLHGLGMKFGLDVIPDWLDEDLKLEFKNPNQISGLRYTRLKYIEREFELLKGRILEAIKSRDVVPREYGFHAYFPVLFDKWCFPIIRVNGNTIIFIC